MYLDFRFIALFSLYSYIFFIPFLAFGFSFPWVQKHPKLGLLLLFLITPLLGCPIWLIFIYQLFSGETYFLYYFILLAVTLIIWTILNYSKWGRNHIRKVAFYCLFPMLSITAILFGLYHNPTVYLHNVYFKTSTVEKTYWNKDILNLLKQNENLIALDILERIDKVESIEFQDVRENPEFRRFESDDLQFSTRILINGQWEIYYSFSMAPKHIVSSDNPDIELHDRSLENTGLKLREPTTVPSYTYQSLDSKEVQEKLSTIPIRYYLKSDIYKDSFRK